MRNKFNPSAEQQEVKVNSSKLLHNTFVKKANRKTILLRNLRKGIRKGLALRELQSVRILSTSVVFEPSAESIVLPADYSAEWQV